MPATKIEVEIESTFNSQGVEEATQAVKETTVAVKEASEASEKVTATVEKTAEAVKTTAVETKKVTQETEKFHFKGEKAFSMLNATSSALQGNLQGVFGVVKNLVQQMPMLSAALGPIGMLMTAFAVWKKVIDTVIENQKQLEQSMIATFSDNMVASIGTTMKAYESLTKEIDKTTEASKRASNAMQSKDDSQLKKDLAELELKYEQDKALLNPDDELSRKQLDLQYSKDRDKLTTDAGVRKNDRDYELLSTQEEAASTKVLETMAVKTELQGDEKALLKKYFQAYKKAQDSQDWERWLPILQDLAKKREEVSQKLSTIDDTIDASQAQADTLWTQMQSNRVEKDVLGLQKRTTGIKQDVAQRDVVLGENKRVDEGIKLANEHFTDAPAEVTQYLQQYMNEQAKNNQLTLEVLKMGVETANNYWTQLEAMKERSRRL